MATRHYVGIAESDGNGWSLGFPAFPGTVTTGDTLAELVAHARDALASVVAAMEDDGQALPVSVDADPRSSTYDLADYVNPHVIILPVEVSGRAARINVTMDEGLVSRLDSLAERTNASRSALLARGARMVLAAAEAGD
jgi:predicted RNase H-like HicB family nuclease